MKSPLADPLRQSDLPRAAATGCGTAGSAARRPIFHHLDHRVETHIFLCLPAYAQRRRSLLRQSASRRRVRRVPHPHGG